MRHQRSLFFHFIFYIGSFLSIPTVQSQNIIDELLKKINSRHDEQNPVFSKTGEYLFITRSNHPENIGGVRDLGDIWISTRKGDTWSEPTHGGGLINNRGYNAVAGLFANDSRLVIMNHVSKDNEQAKTQGLAIFTRRADGWSTPQNVNIPNFHTRSILSGALSENGDIFVYAADTYGTMGVEDLYVIFLENGKWTEPKSLGTAVNTVFQEVSPSLNFNTDTLFFSSNRKGGNGSFDVYAAARLDNTWTNWSDPINLTTINTEGRELYYRAIGRGSGIYTSNKNSNGYGDISVYVQSANTMQFINTQSEILGIPTSGTIFDSVSQQNIQAQLIFTNTEGYTTGTQSTTQGYSILLIPSTYRVLIEAEGYISRMINVVIPDTDSLKQIQNYSLVPAIPGTTVVLSKVLFEQRSTIFLHGSVEELEVVISFLKKNPKVKIELGGHTENVGSHKDNVKLSKARADKVMEYLIQKGISSERLVSRGYGGTKPIVRKAVGDQHLNRRVEFIIINN